MVIREYCANLDREHVLDLSIRLSDFDIAEQVSREVFLQSQRGYMLQSLDEIKPCSVLLVVRENNSAEAPLLGFLELNVDDCWLAGGEGKQKQGYVSKLVLSKEAEGKGIARELMDRAENWAKDQGFVSVALDVFAENKGAIGMYEHLGYDVEAKRMVKWL
jgi:GNAT superfamily N-acetyltransferase